MGTWCPWHQPPQDGLDRICDRCLKRYLTNLKKEKHNETCLARYYVRRLVELQRAADRECASGDADMGSELGSGFA